MSGRDERVVQKIVINAQHGGFGLSNEACERLIELGYEGLTPVPEGKGEKRTLFDNVKFYGHRDIPRNHPLLIQVVEELGIRANGLYANLIIIEIPSDVCWTIEEYDGFEHIAEEHKTWG